MAWSFLLLHELLENLEELGFGDFTVPVFIDRLNEFADIFCCDVFIPAQTGEGILDQYQYFIFLQGPTLIGVVLIEYSVNGLS